MSFCFRAMYGNHILELGNSSYETNFFLFVIAFLKFGIENVEKTIRIQEWRIHYKDVINGVEMIKPIQMNF